LIAHLIVTLRRRLRQTYLIAISLEEDRVIVWKPEIPSVMEIFTQAVFYEPSPGPGAHAIDMVSSQPAIVTI